MKQAVALFIVLSVVVGCSGRRDVQLQELEAENREQTKELLRSEQELERLQEKMQKVENKLSELEKMADARAGDQESLQPEPVDKAPSLVVKKRDSSDKEEDNGSAPAPKTSNAENLYSRALGVLLKKNEPVRARKLFNAFLAKYQGHPLEPNGLYWLGETYYVQKRFAEAILIFKEVIQRFPTHSKSSDSMLKIGYAYSGLEDKQNARFYLKTLVSEYPATPAAEKAAEHLKRMGE